MSPHARNALPIAIAGGGIGGLACALALAQRGFHSIVLEQAAEFGEAGVGLQVAPNALSVLDALGVGEAAKEHALLIERLVMMDAVTGAEVINIPCGDRFRERFGNPYAVAHRADIHGALLNACRTHAFVILRNSCRVSNFDIDDRRVTVMLESGEHIAAAALIGADGVDSVVRSHLLNDGPPRASGAVIYRAAIPFRDMPKDLHRPYPTFWAGPGWHVIYYPVRDWTMFNLGATFVAGETTPSESEEVTQRYVLPFFTGSCATPLRVLRIPKTYRRYSVVHREPVETWSKGPVTLLGDAAHAMVQYIAQGAAMALEDAICIAACAYESNGDFIEAFRSYQDARAVRAARVQVSSALMDKINHAKGVERKVRNSLFEGRTDEEFYERLAWLFTPPPYVRPFKP